MRIIHTGDLHLDTIPEASPAGQDSFFRASSSRRWHTLERMIAYANDWEADLILICGDLFHRQPTLAQLREVNDLFDSLTGARVVLMAGNHDCLLPGSPAESFPWTDRLSLLPPLTALPKAADGEIYFPELRTVVHGFSYSSIRIREALYDGLTAPRDQLYHILMVHGGDPDHLPLRFPALEQAGFDYVALGHIHQPRIFPGRRMAYCGSPEPLDQTETGNHGFMQIDLRGNELDLSFVPFSRSRFIPLSFSISPEDTLSSLRSSLMARMAKGNAGDRYAVRFTGERDPELSLSMDAFSDLPQLYELSDDTLPWYDFSALLKSHGSDLIGQFIRSFLPPGKGAEELDELHAQALYLGLQALLGSADNRTIIKDRKIL